MATRRSSRKRKQPAAFRGEDQLARQVSSTAADRQSVTLPDVQVEQAEVLPLSVEQMDTLVDKVTEKILKALDGKANKENSMVPDRQSQVKTGAVDAVQGSVSAVLDNLSKNGEITSVPIVVNDDIDEPRSPLLSGNVPLGMQISDKIRAKILSNEYVDFGSLLNKHNDSNNAYQLCVSETRDGRGSSFVMEPKFKNTTIANIEMWTSAFQIFVAIYSEKFNLEVPGLMKYGSTIRELASRGFNWKYYDENFRHLRHKEPNKYSWGSVHPELWIMAQPNVQMQNRFNNSNKSYMQNHQGGNDIPHGYCRKYHNGRMCFGCNYSHACPKCKQNHSAKKCNFRGQSAAKGKALPNFHSTSAPSNTSKGK